MRARTLFVLLSTAATTAACSDSVGPTVQPLAGTYQAFRPASGGPAFGALTTTQAGVATDWLAEGAEVRLTLLADGRTTGRLFLPNVNEEGEREQGVNFEADLAGTWSLAGDVVSLDHEADTFLRDMALRVVGGRLVGDETFGGVRVQLVLDRTA